MEIHVGFKDLIISVWGLVGLPPDQVDTPGLVEGNKKEFVLPSIDGGRKTNDKRMAMERANEPLVLVLRMFIENKKCKKKRDP